jgi:serine/threonine protein kinase
MKRRATHGGHLPGDTNCSISVTLVQATGLKKKTSSPYALVRVGNVEQRTKAVTGSVNPSWNETFEFSRVSEQHALVRIALYCADPLAEAADRFLGESIVPVASLTAEDEKPTWHELEVRPGSAEFVCGQLCVKIKTSGKSFASRPAAEVAPVVAASAAAPPAVPSLKRARQSVVDRQSFGQTAFSKMFVISPSDIDFSGGKVLGEGGFGTVRLGLFRGLPVAVKTLIPREDVKRAELVDEFRQEVAMLAKVSHHPKLCLFLGASVVEPLTLVSELMAGSVRNLLDKPRPESTQLLPWARRVEILLDASLGMAFLHGMNVVHRDMKADNLLLDEHGTTKVADFGLSKTLATSSAKDEVGTPGFMAAEIYVGGRDRKARSHGPSSCEISGYSLPVDVFAFGATIYELLSFEGDNWGWPYGWALDLATDVQVEQAVRAGKLPTALGGSPVPSDCPRALRALYEASCLLDPASRPSFDDIVPRLRDVLRLLRGGGGDGASSSSSTSEPSVPVATTNRQSSAAKAPLAAPPPPVKSGGAAAAPTTKKKKKNEEEARESVVAPVPGKMARNDGLDTRLRKEAVDEELFYSSYVEDGSSVRILDEQQSGSGTLYLLVAQGKKRGWVKAKYVERGA